MSTITDRSFDITQPPDTAGVYANDTRRERAPLPRPRRRRTNEFDLTLASYVFILNARSFATCPPLSAATDGF